jgi:hypothetical protein
MSELKFIDSWKTVAPKLNLERIDIFADRSKKNLQARGVARDEAIPFLEVTFDATYSGTVVNGRVYRGPKMKAATPQWLNPYPKPILNHHDDHKDSIGRVSKAKYFRTVDMSSWQSDYIGCKKGDTGSGFIQLVGEITDREAIDKYLDGRNRTFSTSQRTNSAVCNICGSDMMKGEWCGHVPGRKYKPEPKKEPDNEFARLVMDYMDKRSAGKGERMCYYVFDELSYLEASNVNIPAQVHAQVRSLELKNQDSFSDEELTSLMDSFFPKDPEVPVREMSDVSFSDGFTTVSLFNEEKSKGFVTSLPNKDEDVDSAPAKNAKDEDVDGTCEDCEYGDEEFANLHILSTLDSLGYITLDDDEAELVDEFRAVVEDEEDAKLSAKQRKKLGSKTFCGPNRSFPVPDCAHVTAARRLIGRYKGPGSKKAILACVNRKAKALGCDTKKKGDSEGDTAMSDETQASVAESFSNTLSEVKTELKLTQGKLTDAEEAKKTADKANEELIKTNNQILADQLFDMRVVLGDADPEKRKDEVEQLASRSTDSLKDAVADARPRYEEKLKKLLEGKPETDASAAAAAAGTVTDPTATKDGDGEPAKDGEDKDKKKKPSVTNLF